MKRSRSTVVALLTTAALVLAGCGGSDEPTTNADGTTEVTVNYLPVVALAPLFVGEDQGFFTKRGIRNNLASADIYARLAVQAKGDLDVNIPGTGGAFFNAVNQGLSLKAVTDRQQYRCASDNLLLVRSEQWQAGVRDIPALRGKKVAILAKGSTTEYWLDTLLQRHGMTQDDLGEVVNLSYPDTANALKSGAIDAGFLTQPLASTMLTEQVAHRMHAMHEVAPDQQQGLITMSDAFLKDQPELATQWVAAWIESVRFYADPANKDAVLTSIAKWTQIDRAVVEPLYGTDQWPYMNPNGEVDTEAIDRLDGKWLVENKVVTQLPAESAWLDRGPVERALQELGRVEGARDCSALNLPKLGG